MSQKRTIRDMRAQRAEIIKHLYKMVLQRGQIVTLDEAARDWIPQYAATWRARNKELSLS